VRISDSFRAYEFLYLIVTVCSQRYMHDSTLKIKFGIMKHCVAIQTMKNELHCTVRYKPKNVGITVLGLVNVQSDMCIMFQLYDVLRFDSTVIINVLIYISSLKLNNQLFFNFRSIVHEYTENVPGVAMRNPLFVLMRRVILRSCTATPGRNKTN